MLPEARQRARKAVTQIVGLPRPERVRALEVYFPQDAPSQKEILSLLDVYDAAARQSNVSTTEATTVRDTAADGQVAERPADELLKVGDAYGPYRVMRQIGVGGMGQVFLAEDVRLGRHVALKSLAGKWLDAPNARLRLMREARAVAALAHPNIATLFDVFEDADCLLLVMEYVDGRTIKDAIDAGPMPADQALRIAVQVAGAIGYAHDHGVIHCDLKPANIQVAPSGVAKVLDFGLARLRYAEGPAVDESVTTTGVVLGTPGYIAPERLLRGTLTASGDIYSIGVVLFEMITGRRLFINQEPEQWFDIVSKGPAKASSVAPHLPAGLDEVIERALAVEPAARYQSAHELGRDLQAILTSLDTGGPGVLVTRASAEPAVGRFAMRAAAEPAERSIRLVAGAASGLVVVSLAGFITSGVYNFGIGRSSEFDPESPLMYLVWGLRSLVAPGVLAALALIALAVASTLGRIPLRIADPLTRKWLSTSKRVQAWRAWMSEISVHLSAPVLLIAELMAFGFLCSRFAPLLSGLVGFVAANPSADLSVLSPANIAEHRLYRQLFSIHLLVFSAAWFAVVTIRARQLNQDARIVVAGGLALTLLSFLLLVAPYRIMSHNHAERASLGAQHCYLVGQRSSDGLLFCPAQSPPWSRIVRLDDPGLKREGTRESIFKEVE